MRYDLPGIGNRAVAVGYEQTTDTFYGYVFGRTESSPIYVDHTEKANGELAAARAVIDAVRAHVTTVAPGLAETLHASRLTGDTRPPHVLRIGIIDEHGYYHAGNHTGDPDIDTLSILRKHVRGSVDHVNLGAGLDAWLNDEGMYTMEPNVYGSRMLWNLGAHRQMFHGPIVFTCYDGPETVSLTEIHANRLSNTYDATWNPNVRFKVGDTVAVRVNLTSWTSVKVTRRYGNLEPGRPGFDALTFSGQSLYLYDRQVLRVIERLS